MSSVDGDGLTDGTELDVGYILVLVMYVGTLEDCCVGTLGGSCELVTTGSWVLVTCVGALEDCCIVTLGGSCELVTTGTCVLTSLISTVEEDGCTELVVVILTEND